MTDDSDAEPEVYYEYRNYDTNDSNTKINHSQEEKIHIADKEITTISSSSSDDDVVIIDVKSKIDIPRMDSPDIPDSILYDENIEQLSNHSDSDSLPIPNTPPDPTQPNLSYQSKDDESENYSDSYDDVEPIQLEKGAQPSALDQMNEKLRLLREKYLMDVEQILKEYGCTQHQEIKDPPVFENMTDKDFEEELKKYGFRFTTRSSAISKLTRIWDALHQNKVDAFKVLGPIDFIRLKSQYYEDILVYNPIPLMSLFREMTNAGVKITVNKLKEILEKEGVAYADESSV